LLLTGSAARPDREEIDDAFREGPVIADMGWWALLLVVVVIVGSSNAVNLTDGLDGLATGCTLTVALTYAVMCYVAGNFRFASYLQVPFVSGAGELTVVCAALIGASLGFFVVQLPSGAGVHGRHRFEAIGGLIGAIAVMIKQELVLVIVGGIFVMEAPRSFCRSPASSSAASGFLRWRRCITISSCAAGRRPR
jgi:phospho-N-acetylmuramoyl-pentapeptide-transferase